jgi:hypothetical protein
MGPVDRIVDRFLAAGYTGWDPPDDPDPDVAEELWEDALSHFPRNVQHLFGKRERHERHHHSTLTTTTLEATVELNEDTDSGINLTVTATTGVEADEDGPYSMRDENIEYSLVAPNRTWHDKDVSRLQHDFHEFVADLKRTDPVAAAKIV